ncbi:MAG: hypothetical protein NVS2B8_12810 [Vulcanimicrobiaceae bacterium]
MTGPLEREMTLGIDAENLARDRRGMGRLARGVLRAIAESGHFEVVLLADDRRLRRSLAEEFPYAIAATKSAALGGTRYVLFVGPSEDRKNVRLAIEACARAFRREDEALVIAGTLAPADRAFARARHVRAGEIDASDAMLRALYRNAELVLVPSLAEGFGLVAVEAMACGAAVIASDATALPEATGGAAVLIDPHDAATWAGAVRTLLDDPQRLAALRERATTRFAFADRTAFGRATLGLLRELGAR